MQDFYKFAFVGIMLEWIRTGMTADPKDIVSRMSVLLHGDVRPRAAEIFTCLRWDRNLILSKIHTHPFPC